MKMTVFWDVEKCFAEMFCCAYLVGKAIYSNFFEGEKSQRCVDSFSLLTAQGLKETPVR
jgi:hypothetical protein